MNDYPQRTCYGRWMSETYEPRLVSVIVPTYNRAGFIVETLDSIFGQTYRPIEVFVIDDGSTDYTREIVEEWRRKHAEDTEFELSYLLQKHSGAPAARNFGLIESCGEFIQFIDSDDLLAPSKIGNQIHVLPTCESKTAIYGRWRYFINSKNGIEVYKVSTRTGEDNSLKNWIGGRWAVPPHSILWKRNDIAQLGPWDESLAADQDGDFSMRFLLRGGKLVFCPSAWVYHRLYEDPESSVGGSESRKSFESRYRVIARIEDELTTKGMLDEYRRPLSLRYAIMANAYALYHKDLANLCLKNSMRLSHNGKLPDVFSHPFLSRLLGLNLKKRIGYLGRSLFGISARSSSGRPMVPIATVESAAKLCFFYEVGQQIDCGRNFKQGKNKIIGSK